MRAHFTPTHLLRFWQDVCNPFVAARPHLTSGHARLPKQKALLIHFLDMVILSFLLYLRVIQNFVLHSPHVNSVVNLFLRISPGIRRCKNNHLGWRLVDHPFRRNRYFVIGFGVVEYAVVRKKHGKAKAEKRNALKC